MSERTTTIAGVTVTEQQLRDALKRLETPAEWLPRGFPSIKAEASDGRMVYIERRDCGEYEGRGFYLGDGGIGWTLVRDSYGMLVLVPKDFLLEKGRR